MCPVSKPDTPAWPRRHRRREAGSIGAMMICGIQVASPYGDTRRARATIETHIRTIKHKFSVSASIPPCQYTAKGRPALRLRLSLNS